MNLAHFLLRFTFLRFMIGAATKGASSLLELRYPPSVLVVSVVQVPVEFPLVSAGSVELIT